MRSTTLLLLVGAAAACGAESVASACGTSQWQQDTTLVIAHAGGSVLAPANTTLALERGAAAGADLLDLDIRMSSDGVLVARHDRDVSRTTDGVGNVDELTWAELSSLDTAATWDGDTDGPVRMARVDDALREFADYTISLELKQISPSMAQPLCDLLVEFDAFDRVYISSNDDRAVFETQAACPDVQRTTTFQDLDERRQSLARGEQWCAAAPIGQPQLAGRGRDEMTQLVDAFHSYGSAVFGWTLNSETDIRNAVDAGVDAIYTDRPDLARRIIDEASAAD